MPHTPEKGCLIREIRENQTVEGLFLIKELSRAETKAGKPYLMLTIMDCTGQLAGRVWEEADRWLEQCRVGGVVSLSGVAQSFKGVLQLKISSLQGLTPDQVDLAEFVPAAPGDRQAMAAEVLQLVKFLENPFLRELLQLFFKDRKFFNLYKKAPAAKSMHHAYVGGLLEHSLSVARLADRVAGLYPALDRSLLLAGALLHDIGKVEEFSFESYPFDYTDGGRLMGHHVLGVEMIQARIRTMDGFPPELAMRLKHLILSHHGRYEYGSPTLPMMLEAFVLHFLDDMDAKLNTIEQLRRQNSTADYQWTDYQRSLERFLFVPGHPADETPGEPGANEIDPRQQSLWNL